MGEVLDEDKPVTDPTRRTGRLFIQIGGDDQRQFRRRWHDTKTQPLERLLSQLVETLAKAIEVMRLDRLDAECVARQEKRAAEVRKAADDRESREFYWRQDFHRDIGLWHEAERARAYLRALCARVESKQYVPKDRTLFERWLAWATRYCDAIDPLVGVRHPDDVPPPPQNTQVNALDVTSVLRILSSNWRLRTAMRSHECPLNKCERREVVAHAVGFGRRSLACFRVLATTCRSGRTVPTGDHSFNNGLVRPVVRRSAEGDHSVGGRG